MRDPTLSPAKQPFRVTSCNRDRKGDTVGMYRTLDGSNARLTGIVTCGSVWHCPVCAAKITEKRRMELQRALINHQLAGGEAYLLTLTHPHTSDLPIALQLELQAKARQRFKNCKTYKRIMKRFARAGSVCSLETTYGWNGFHPHTHDLIFAQPGLLEDKHAIEELTGEWVRILFKVGLGNHEKIADMYAHSLDIKGGNFAADYIAKFGREPSWSEAHELTKSHSKIGGRMLVGITGHVTPFKLLEWYLDGDLEAGRIFIEYAKAFQGKRMITWSKHLKKKLGIADLTDEQLAGDESPLPAEEYCGELSADDWRVVLERDARGELIFILAKNGLDGVKALIHELREHRPKTHRGDSDCFVQKPRWAPAGVGWNELKSTERSNNANPG